jgi:hypothetical protein
VKSALSISVLLAFCLGLKGQTLFTAEADRYKVAVGETFTVTFKINANTSDFDYPDFASFRVVSGPMTGMSTSIINGKMSQERSAAFDLIALKTGTYSIKPAKVKADGKVYQTKALTIKVVEQSDRPANTLEARAAELAKLKILTNKRNVYVGEPISVRYALLLKTNVGQFDVLEEPDFQGFIKNDIELKNYEAKKETVDGESVNAVDISTFVLVPQQTGNQKPGALHLRLPTNVPTGRRDWFGQREMRTVNQICKSTFPTIKVNPLPAGKPAGFSGGVGDYKLYVNLSRNEVKANESVTLTVEVSGKGNIQLIELPAPILPNSIESYEPKYKDDIRIKKSGITGYKRNEYLLLPRFRGTYKIPPLKFSFFDPNKEEYITLASDAFEINVTEGPEAQQIPGNTSPGTTDKSTVAAIGSDILFIHTTPSAFEKEEPSFFTSLWHKLIVAILVVILALGYGYFRFRQGYKPDKIAQVKRKAAGKALRRIKDAKPLIAAKQVEAFYGELTGALQDFYAEKFHLLVADFNADAAVELIAQNGGNADLSNAVKHILRQADMARFAPLTQANMEADHQQALRIINKLDELT